VVGVLAVASVFAVDVLGDLTQTRPDHPDPGGATEVSYEVILRDERRPRLQAAQALWGACQGTVQRNTSPVDVRLDGRVARIVVAPALGTHARQRLSGCLEDATLDRIRGDVVAMKVLR
jgi:hypothetical protein